MLFRNLDPEMADIETRKGWALDMIASNTLEISQDILDSARLTVDDLKKELAIILYDQGRLSIGKARELAEMSLWEFRQLLSLRGISPHFDATDLEEDLSTLRELERL
jgi:predicted HTH domain antitoxin